ncbi:MAG: hypothetical protein VKI42_08420, partial [Synechococcaceae cyanobacterium]|nr:hypothetical protein [Synechococcaceae cyanobacterium]
IPSNFRMSRIDRFSRAGLALVAAGCLTVAGCSATKQAASDVGDAAKTAASATGDAAQNAASGAGDMAKTAASGVGDAAKTAATTAGQAALAPALNPVLDLLSKGQEDLKSGNVGAAITAMGGFQSLWEKAGPVIQPLAGDKWGAIDSAAKTVISTFGSGAKPDAAAAGSAISGLMGPLKALAGK